jgi:hypothetical protein
MRYPLTHRSPVSLSHASLLLSHFNTSSPPLPPPPPTLLIEFTRIRSTPPSSLYFPPPLLSPPLHLPSLRPLERVSDYHPLTPFSTRGYKSPHQLTHPREILPFTPFPNHFSLLDSLSTCLLLHATMCVCVVFLLSIVVSLLLHFILVLSHTHTPENYELSDYMCR